MTAPTQRELAVKENPLPYQAGTFDQVIVGYNAYSPSGDVTGEVVYANYGRPEDFAELDRLGVSVRDPLRGELPRRQGQAGGGARCTRRDHLLRPGGRVRPRPGLPRRPVEAGPTRSSAARSSTSSSTPAIRSRRSSRPCPARGGRARRKRATSRGSRPCRSPTARPSTCCAPSRARRRPRSTGAASTSRTESAPARHRPARPRHRLRTDARVQRRRRDPRRVAARGEGGDRRPLRRVDLRGRRQHERLDDRARDRPRARPPRAARRAARAHDRAGGVERRGIRPARLDGMGGAVARRPRARRRRLPQHGRRRRARVRRRGHSGARRGALRRDRAGRPAGRGQVGLRRVARGLGGSAGGRAPGSGSDYTAFLDHVGVPILEVGFSSPGGEYHTP
jgi:hypothetical protein